MLLEILAQMRVGSYSSVWNSAMEHKDIRFHLHFSGIVLSSSWFFLGLESLILFGLRFLVKVLVLLDLFLKLLRLDPADIINSENIAFAISCE